MGLRIKAFRARTTYAPIAKRVGARRKTILFIEKGAYNPFNKVGSRHSQNMANDL